MKKLIYILISFLLLSCSNSDLFEDEARHDLWLVHEGAELPIVVEGNTNSKVFLILLHGGPGGSSQEFNAGSKPFSDLIEEDFAAVYYDQRNAGLARGEWDPEKLTIEQHIEDLDLVIDLLYHKFGTDIKIFLAGHSWGGYLGTAYLLNEERQSKVKAFINIDGAIHRDKRNRHCLEYMIEIAEEQIADDTNVENWTNLKNDAEEELSRNVMYDEKKESIPNALISRSQVYIEQDGLVTFNSNSPLSSAYRDNYDPLLILINDRKGTLIEQMYLYDLIIESNLERITLPVLSVYGKYDVVTAFEQGEYLLDGISTPSQDKRMILLEKSGHSSMKNEPVDLAMEIIEWIETYQ